MKFKTYALLCVFWCLDYNEIMVSCISRYFLITLVLSSLRPSFAQELSLNERTSPKLNPVLTQKTLKSPSRSIKISELIALFETSIDGKCMNQDRRIICNTRETGIFEISDYLANNGSNLAAKDQQEILARKPMMDLAIFAHLDRDAGFLGFICETNGSSQFFSSTWTKSAIFFQNCNPVKFSKAEPAQNVIEGQVPISPSEPTAATEIQKLSCASSAAELTSAINSGNWGESTLPAVTISDRSVLADGSIDPASQEGRVAAAVRVCNNLGSIADYQLLGTEIRIPSGATLDTTQINMSDDFILMGDPTVNSPRACLHNDLSDVVVCNLDINVLEVPIGKSTIILVNSRVQKFLSGGPFLNVELVDSSIDQVYDVNLGFQKADTRDWR